MTQDILAELMELIISFNSKKGIEAVAVTSRGGVNLASSVPPKTSPDTLAAMSSALQNAADILTEHVNYSSAERVVIECERSKIVIVSAGLKALLVVLASENTPLGPLFVDINALARQVEELLAGC